MNRRNDLNNFLINEHCTVREAMAQLDKSGARIIFVTDEDSKLKGSITDGDIRRWILKDGNLQSLICNMYNPKTYFLYEGYDVQVLQKEMREKGFNAVPILDAEKKIKKLLWWDDVFQNIAGCVKLNKIEIPIVIMAGGKGTRLDPFTKILPKPLIPIGDKSILEVIIDKFLKHDIDTVFVSVNHKSKIIKSYFEELNPPYNINYINEEKPLGTAGCLSQLQEEFNGAFLLTNCDIIIDIDYCELIDHHKKNGYDITLVASFKHYNIPYGICEIGSGGLLTSIREKPEYSFLINTGMYVVESEWLKIIPEDKMYHITNLIEDVTKKGGKVGVFPISENAWVDTGEWSEYKKTLEKLKI